MTELVRDLLEGDSARLQTLVLAAQDERLGGREEGPWRDQQVVGLVRRRAQAGRRRDGDAGGKQRL